MGMLRENIAGFASPGPQLILLRRPWMLLPVKRCPEGGARRGRTVWRVSPLRWVLRCPFSAEGRADVRALA